MDWLGQLNDALQYIEGHLDGELDLEQVARLACCSSFHFQRMFSYMAGVPLAEYIRRRRMTRAAFDLQNTEDKIIDIALRYGYDSPTAFNRAFQGIHGVAPSHARHEGAPLKAYPPISFKITIRGEAEMNYRIEKKDAFRIVGKKLQTNWTQDNPEAFAVIPKFWDKTREEGVIPTLCESMDGMPKGVLGVSIGDLNKSSQFDYYIAVASNQPLPQGMEETIIPASTWAIFECIGPMPTAIQRLQQRIMTEWFPNSGYQYAEGADIEVYTEGDTRAEDYQSWIWVPVKKA